MQTLIVYYSLEGNTAQTAQEIATELGADLLQLEPVKAYPTGKVSKFVWGGKSVVFSEKPKLKDYTFERTVDETDDEILKWNGGIYAIRSTVRWGGNRYRSKREELNVIRLWRKKP